MQITENLVAVSFNVTLLRFAGDTAVGAVTVLTTTMSLSMQLLHGLTQGAQPIMSFNYGAGNGRRVRETFRIVSLNSCLSSALSIASALVPISRTPFSAKKPSLSSCIAMVRPV